MNNNAAKTFVRSLNNSAAKILISFLLARTALDINDLREWTGLKRETLYSALDILRASGIVEKQIGTHGRHTWVTAGDFLPGIFQMSEKRTSELQMSTKRTPELGGGGDSLNLIKLDSPPPPRGVSEKRTPEQERVLQLLRHTHLLFDGSFVNSRGLELCDPDTVLAWCAYAYEQAKNRKSHSPAGLVRSKLQSLEPAPQVLLDGWLSILPEAYLEAIGEIQYVCEFCEQTFGKRGELDGHLRSSHPYVCEECRPVIAFSSQAEWRSHYEQKHDPFSHKSTTQAEETAPAAQADTPEGQAWRHVLTQLQDEMPKASFETWVRDTHAIRYDGNALTVGVRNAYAREWLESRLKSTVERMLTGILNQTVQVQFTVEATA